MGSLLPLTVMIRSAVSCEIQRQMLIYVCIELYVSTNYEAYVCIIIWGKPYSKPNAHF